MNKGLEDIVVAQTKLSRVDGENGALIFCGYDIRELARAMLDAVGLSRDLFTATFAVGRRSISGARHKQ